jgi:hypothetical protein
MYPTQKKRIIKKKHGFHKKIEIEDGSEKQNKPNNAPRKQQG